MSICNYYFNFSLLKSILQTFLRECHKNISCLFYRLIYHETHVDTRGRTDEKCVLALLLLQDQLEALLNVQDKKACSIVLYMLCSNTLYALGQISKIKDIMRLGWCR